MHSLHPNSTGAAALQRHRIREKMSSIVLEHDALPFASSPYRRRFNSTATGFACQYQATAQSSGQDTAEVATSKTLPFPSPARNHIGLEGMTQTVIDDNDISSSGARKKTSPPSQLVTEVDKNRRQSIKSQHRSLTLTKSSGRRGTKRHCDENTHSPTRKLHLGNIYDLQLDRRAMTSSKRQKVPNHGVAPTTRDRKMKSHERNDTSKDADTSPLSPVKRCLYQNDEEDDKEVLTPTRMDDDDVTNHHRNLSVDRSGSDDEDAFATIRHFLRVLE